jgi:hypothetical protein
LKAIQPRKNARPASIRRPILKCALKIINSF